MSLLKLTGKDLTIADLVSLVSDERKKVAVSASALAAVGKSHRVLLAQARDKVIYGVNTGFGPMSSRRIQPADAADLQANLVRSHATGMGEPLPESYVLASMVVRLNTLCKGYSGVSRELVERLALFINKRIIPVVPEHGGVGASGDLVQLAHIALALMGEGDVFVNGKRQRARSALRRLRIAPYALKPKEGLSLVNGTSVMTGVAALVISEAEAALELSIRAGAFALELAHSFDDSIAEALHRSRPHEGQLDVARRLRAFLSSSNLLQKRYGPKASRSVDGSVQEVYSLRCIPQIAGPIAESLSRARNVVETEMNAATDNPLVDIRSRTLLHGGNFHGEYIAAALDDVKAGLAKLAVLSERRVNFFLNADLNKRFPPFLNAGTPGLTLGLQGLQFTATSTAAESQSLAYPHRLHSIPSNADNQDVVSMGCDAALIAARVLENAWTVLAVELATLAQAADCAKEAGRLSHSSRELYKNVRASLPNVVKDRSLSEELRALKARIKSL